MGLALLVFKQCSLRFSPLLGRQCLAATADLRTNCTWRSFSAQPVPQEHGVGSDGEAAVAAPHALQQSELQAQESQYKRQQELSASRNLLDLLNAASQRAYGPLFSGNITKGTAKRGAEVLLQFAPLRLLLSQYSHHGQFPATQEMLGKWERQLRLEWEALQKLVETYNRSRTQVMKAGAGADLPAADYFLRRWVPRFSEGVIEEVRKAEAGEYGKGDWLTYAPYVSLLPPDALCVLAVHTTMSTMLGESEAGSCKFVTVSSAVGKAINQQVAIELLKKGVRTETKRHKALVNSKKAAWKARQEAKESGELPDKRRLSQILSKYKDKVEEHTASEREPNALPSFHPAGDAVKEAFLREQERFTSRISLLASDCGITEEDWFQGDPEYEACLTDLRDRFKRALRPRKQAAALDDHLRNELTVPTWSNAILAKLGAMMLQVLIRTAMVEVPAKDDFNRTIPGRTTEQPAFEHAILRGLDKHGHAGDKRTSKGWWKRYGVVSMHDAVLARLRNNNFEWHDGFLPKYMPMIIPPLPWSGVYQGGYLTHSTCIMRARGSHRQIDLLKQADRTGQLNRVYEALNALGETAWSINEDVLEAVEYAYQVEGGGMAGLPLHSSKGEPALVPERPPLRYRTEAKHGHMIAAVLPPSGPEFQSWKQQAAAARKLCREMHSLRCDMNYKLAVAQAFRKEASIYFPHNLDFRGRAYPMHPHLNHLGGDVNRGLLQFADAKPLGPSGLKWLKVSVANLFGRGADKLAFSGENGREQFADDHLGQIMDSADDAFGGERWWLQGDSPWQLLAVCKDLRNALACACPEAYLSRLPVHQDGSCNGLQHYAALSRDESGGRAVNLAPVDRPQDVYTAIAIRVRQKMQEDADNGHPLAARLVDAVDRKLVKQTVMTSVYGVTFIGAREQIASRLRERGFPWQDWAELCKLSTYAAQVTLAGLHETFSDAKDIMKWLGTCAKVIASHNEAVQWSTPLGLPVVQPYRQMSRALVATLLQRVILVTADDSLPILKSRQRTAFPPNYIHSLDSSHMLMTAVACKRAGLDFAGVHDSFWSHAGSVDTMNSLLREKFLELHSQPLLQNLMEDFLTNPAYHKINAEDYPQLPLQGQLNLDQIRDARYFFS